MVFAVLVPRIYLKMLDHIANYKYTGTTDSEKITIQYDILNELTEKKHYAFDSRIKRKHK